MVDDACGYIGRSLVFVTVVLGIVFSVIGSTNCNMLKFDTREQEPWGGLDPPFDGVFEARVGVFSYEIVRAADPTRVTNGCVSYDDKFGGSEYAVLIAAQFSALLAPIVASLGLLVNLLDTCICKFFLSFLVASVLFLIASGVQTGVYSLYAEADFCLNGQQYCDLGIAIYWYGISSVLFFVACVLLCCFPTPDPCLMKRKHDESNQRSEPQSNNSTGGWAGYNEKDNEDIDDKGQYDKWDQYGREENDNNGHNEEEVPEPQPKKKKKKKSKKKKTGEIDDDEFDFEVPQSNEGRVEYRERTLRDGRRQVDEITIHPDGSKTVTTQTYDS